MGCSIAHSFQPVCHDFGSFIMPCFIGMQPIRCITFNIMLCYSTFCKEVDDWHLVLGTYNLYGFDIVRKRPHCYIRFGISPSYSSSVHCLGRLPLLSAGGEHIYTMPPVRTCVLHLCSHNEPIKPNFSITSTSFSVSMGLEA